VSATDVQPTSFEHAAEALAAAAEAGDAVRIVGGGTKLAWGTRLATPELTLRTSALDQIVEHNVGDLTAVLQAGVPLAAAQERLALDPALGLDGARDATIGGVIATADSGPLRHRYGAPRDLVVGMTVALSDGTIARSGGKVIKNVAGYDIAKLFAGAFGTLGLILEVTVRLHPLQATSATAVGSASDSDVLAAAGRALAAAPLELDSLDVVWREGRGELLARARGVQAQPRAERIAALMREAGLSETEITTDDEQLWERQRSGQRSSARVLMRLAARPTALPKLLRAVQASSGALVGRAALGISYVELDPDAVASFRERLPSGIVTVVLDGQTEDPWGAPPPAPARELMERIKARFDPARICNPGVFVGGI
jgi:glycolate oxidase FAD binding subunit